MQGARHVLMSGDEGASLEAHSSHTKTCVEMRFLMTITKLLFSVLVFTEFFARGQARKIISTTTKRLRRTHDSSRPGRVAAHETPGRRIFTVRKSVSSVSSAHLKLHSYKFASRKMITIIHPSTLARARFGGRIGAWI
jgi:hypothetical protein